MSPIGAQVYTLLGDWLGGEGTGTMALCQNGNDTHRAPSLLLRTVLHGFRPLSGCLAGTEGSWLLSSAVGLRLI